MKYRKKPVVIEAIQFNENFIGTKCSYEFWKAFENGIISETENKSKLIIKTLEGNMTASIGDYIIKGVNGEFYPCKPDIFEKTYDYVSEEKPPIGLMPQKIFLESRLQDIFKATLRYKQVKKEIPEEWEKEAEEIQNYIETNF